MYYLRTIVNTLLYALVWRSDMIYRLLSHEVHERERDWSKMSYWGIESESWQKDAAVKLGNTERERIILQLVTFGWSMSR